jgi:hypothetical protein
MNRIAKKIKRGFLLSNRYISQIKDSSNIETLTNVSQFLLRKFFQKSNINSQ